MKVRCGFRLSVFVTLVGVGLLSCSYTQSPSATPCKNPEFGIAEEGFANCKPQDAFARLQELAKQGDPKALFMLGRVYNLGGEDFDLPNIKQNYDLAMEYFVRSARLGYGEAQSTIALYYWRGYNETRQKEALYWWCRAALQSDYAGLVNIQMQIKVSGRKQTVPRYCAPILKSPPKQKDKN